MKEFRELSNIIIGFLLFVFIFAFTMGRSTKGIINNDLLAEPIKEHILTTLIDGDNQETIQLSDVFEKGDINEIINLVIDNYVLYSQNENYQLSESDSEKFKGFINKYKNKILTTYSAENKNIAEQEISESLTYDYLNENIKKLFSVIDASVNGIGMKNTVNLYFKLISGRTYFILILCILGSIGLLLLINWSLVKWAKVVGIDLTVTGGILVFLYSIATISKLFITKASNSQELTNLVASVSFAGLLVRGIIALVIGITLIVLYNNYKDKKIFGTKKVPSNNNNI